MKSSVPDIHDTSMSVASTSPVGPTRVGEPRGMPRSAGADLPAAPAGAAGRRRRGAGTSSRRRPPTGRRSGRRPPPPGCRGGSRALVIPAPGPTPARSAPARRPCRAWRGARRARRRASSSSSAVARPASTMRGRNISANEMISRWYQSSTMSMPAWAIAWTSTRPDRLEHAPGGGDRSSGRGRASATAG